jgi:hypothetical protein
MVTFLVGEGDKEKKFIVHKEFACHYSPTLKAAFSSGFLEGQTQTYRLRDTTQGAVQFLLQWFYKQRLDVLQLESTGRYDGTECESLVYLWVLADQLLMPKLQNFIVCRLIEIIIEKHKLLPTHLINFIYKNTSKDSKLRLLFLHLSCFWMRPATFEEKPHLFPKEMLLKAASLVSNDGGANNQLKKAVLAGDWSRYIVPED